MKSRQKRYPNLLVKRQHLDCTFIYLFSKTAAFYNHHQHLIEKHNVTECKNPLTKFNHNIHKKLPVRSCMQMQVFGHQVTKQYTAPSVCELYTCGVEFRWLNPKIVQLYHLNH